VVDGNIVGADMKLEWKLQQMGQAGQGLVDVDWKAQLWS